MSAVCGTASSNRALGRYPAPFGEHPFTPRPLSYPHVILAVCEEIALPIRVREGSGSWKTTLTAGQFGHRRGRSPARRTRVGGGSQAGTRGHRGQVGRDARAFYAPHAPFGARWIGDLMRGSRGGVATPPLAAPPLLVAVGAALWGHQMRVTRRPSFVARLQRACSGPSRSVGRRRRHALDPRAREGRSARRSERRRQAPPAPVTRPGHATALWAGPYRTSCIGSRGFVRRCSRQ